MCLTRFYSVFKVQRPCGLSLFAERKWRMRESNSRPPACKAGALPSELIPRVVRLLNSGFLRVWAERMGPSGLEPPTSRLSGARSNLLSYEPVTLSLFLPSDSLYGDDGIRTHDPLLAGQVLSQLSYTPSFLSGSGHQKLNNKYFPFPSYSTRSPVSFFCSTFDY